MGNYIYATIRSPTDWARVKAGDAACWSYDARGLRRVSPEDVAERARPDIWYDGGWGREPASFATPFYVIRYLEDPPQSTANTGTNSRSGPRRKRGHRIRRQTTRRTYTVTLEFAEKLDLLCEAYRLAPGMVIDRLVDEAYRRDIVSSGLLSLLRAEDDVIAPLP